MYNFQYYPCYNIFIKRYILSLRKETKSDPSPPPTQQSGVCAHNNLVSALVGSRVFGMKTRPSFLK